VGVVAALYRFPVKSMRGEPLREAWIGWFGVEGDRQYAFVRSHTTSWFPWLTGRDVPDLLRYTPRFVEPANTRASSVMVRTPSGAEVVLDSDVLRDDLAARHGGPVHLMQLERGTFDAAPLSLISTATVGDLEARIAMRLDPVRFRQNILLDVGESAPYTEEQWQGRILTFGTGNDSARVLLSRRDKRCMMINLDPDNAAQTPAVLREVVASRDQCAGLYAAPVTTGRVLVGDPVYLDDE
jgi:uncharacterized protein